MYVGLHVKYSLLFSDFSEIWIFSADFQKNSQVSDFIKISLVGALRIVHLDEANQVNRNQ
jgi:hypothetical protein